MLHFSFYQKPFTPLIVKKPCQLNLILSHLILIRLVVFFFLVNTNNSGKSNKSSNRPNEDGAANTSKITTGTGEPIKKSSNLYENNLYSSFAQNSHGTGLNENILSQVLGSCGTNGSYLPIRRERSLDRAPVTENFVENYLITPNASSLRRNFSSGSAQSPNLFNGRVHVLFFFGGWIDTKWETKKSSLKLLSIIPDYFSCLLMICS